METVNSASTPSSNVVASMFLGKGIPSGKRIVESSNTAEVMLTSTKDKFKFNDKACAILGIAAGSLIYMFDQNIGEVVTESMNDRFFITKGWETEKGRRVGATLGKDKGCSYSGIYSGIMMGRPDVTEASVEELVKAGKALITLPTEDGKGGGGFIAVNKVIFEVQKVTATLEDGTVISEFEVDPGRFQAVYALTNMRLEKHETSMATTTDLSFLNLGAGEVDPEEGNTVDPEDLD